MRNNEIYIERKTENTTFYHVNETRLSSCGEYRFKSLEISFECQTVQITITRKRQDNRSAYPSTKYRYVFYVEFLYQDEYGVIYSFYLQNAPDMDSVYAFLMRTVLRLKF